MWTTGGTVCGLHPPQDNSRFSEIYRTRNLLHKVNWLNINQVGKVCPIWDGIKRCVFTYHCVCSVYDACWVTSRPDWWDPARSLAGWLFSSPTGWDWHRTHTHNPLTLHKGKVWGIKGRRGGTQKEVWGGKKNRIQSLKEKSEGERQCKTSSKHNLQTSLKLWNLWYTEKLVSTCTEICSRTLLTHSHAAKSIKILVNWTDCPVDL